MLRPIPLVLLLLACGGSTASRAAASPIDLALRLTPGAVYEIHHRERRQLDDEAAHMVRTHVLVEVGERLPDGGLRMRAQLVRTALANGADPQFLSTLLDFDLDPHGDIRGAARVRCPTGDDLHVTRLLRSLFSVRTVTAERLDEGTTWRRPFYGGDTEHPTRSRWRVDEIDRDSVDGHFVARLLTDGRDIGPFRITGEGRARGHFHVLREDGFSGHTLIDAVVRGDIVDPIAEGRTQGTVQVRTDIQVRLAGRDSVLAESCDGYYDHDTIRSAVGAHTNEIQQCYNRLSAQEPALNGRVDIRFQVDPDGRLRGVEIVENTAQTPKLGACVVTAIRDIRLPPAPVRPTQVSLPFVFGAER